MKARWQRFGATRWPMLVIVAMVAWFTACNQPAAMLRAMDARQRTADLAAQFHTASEATNRAVMADTDKGARALVAEARTAIARAQTDLDTLTSLIQGLGYQPEVTQVAAFGAAFARYRELDERILALAGENSNLEAQRLAFGEGATQADAVAAALTSIAGVAPRDWRARAVAAEVGGAVRELQALQAPHIAAAEDAAMNEIERRMATVESRVRQGLSELSKGSPAGSTTAVATAVRGFDAFMVAHRQILELSRRNTNVRSLALVLNEKGVLTQRCDEALAELERALDTHTSYGSR